MKKLFLLPVALVSTMVLAQQPQSYTEIDPGTVVNGTAVEAVITGANNRQPLVDTYTTLVDFQAAVTANCSDPTLTFEDFSGGPGGITTCGSSMSSAGDGCFAPGDLEDGFVITANGANSQEVVYIPNGAIGNTMPLVGPNSFGDNTRIDFDPPVYAVAMSIWSNTDPNTTITISGPGGVIETLNLTLSTGTEVFVGFIADEPVDAIDIVQANDSGELFGQFYFGANCEVLGTGDNLLAEVQIYPNPVNSVLNVRTPAGLTVDNAQLFNVLGKNTGVRLVNGQIDVSQLARGVYILNLETSEGTLTQKVVKQ
jgi:hypothetical protein